LFATAILHHERYKSNGSIIAILETSKSVAKKTRLGQMKAHF